MIRSFLSTTFAMPAILFASLAIALFGLRIRMLDADLYIQTLRQANAYQTLKQISAEQLIDFQNSYLQNEEAKDFGPILAGQVLDTLISNVDFTQLIETTTEKNIEYVFDWANGKEETIYIYFPRQQIIDSYASDGNPRELFFDHFFQASGINDLPKCPSFEIYKTIDDLDMDNLDCVNRDVKRIIRKELNKRLPKDPDLNFIEATLDEVAPDLNEKTDLRMLQMGEESQKQEFASNMDRAQKLITQSELLIIGIFGVSVALAFVAGLIAKKHTIVFFRVFAYAGAITSIISIIMRFGVISITNIFLVTEINVDAKILSPEQVNTIKEMVRLIVQGIMIDILQTTAIIGLIVLVISIVLIFISKRTGAYSKISEEEVEDSLEEINYYDPNTKYRKNRIHDINQTGEEGIEPTVVHPNKKSFEQNILEQEREDLKLNSEQQKDENRDKPISPQQ